MITEPLTSEIVMYPDGFYAAAIIDRDGKPVTGEDIDQTAWKRDMLRALSIVGQFHKAATVVIVHPHGYGH